MEHILKGIDFSVETASENYSVGLYNRGLRVSFVKDCRDNNNYGGVAHWESGETLKFPLGVYDIDIYDQEKNLIEHKHRFARVEESSQSMGETKGVVITIYTPCDGSGSCSGESEQEQKECKCCVPLDEEEINSVFNQ